MLEIIQENIIEIICAGASSAAAGVIIWIARRLKGLFVAVKADSHDKLYRYGKFYILTNQITLEEMESLSEIYDGYHGLGGNGTGTEIYQRCLELPVVKERTKWNPYYIGQDGYIGK